MPTQSAFERQSTLTGDPQKQRAYTETYKGMAHFAGTGDSRTCSDCGFFEKKRSGKGVCSKFQQLMPQMKTSPNFPGRTASCRYIFEFKK